MTEIRSDLAGLDTIVNLYLYFRGEGESQESAWRWACRIAACMAELDFQEAIEADLAALPVMGA